jgi:putative flippase GtrA
VSSNRPDTRASAAGTAFRFCIVGGLTALIHYSLLFGGVELLRLNTTLASSVGFVAAVIFNYLMHYSWTFGEPAPHGRTLWRYGVMIGCGFLINGGLMYAGVNWTGWHYLLVQTLVFIVVIAWNMIVSSLWVFRS